MMRKTFFIPFLLLFLSACSSVYFSPVYINVNRPANNLILSVKDSMLLVDNALAIPDSVFAKVFFSDKSVKTVIFDRSDVKRIMIKHLSEEMYKSKMFSDIAVYTVPQRTDTNWDKPLRLTPEQLDTIFAQSGAKWILSLDCLKYNCDFFESPIKGTPFVNLRMQTIVQPVFRLFKKGNYNEVKQYYLKDTLIVDSDGLNFNDAISDFDCKSALDGAIKFTADKAYHRWLPYSEEQERVIGKNSNDNMKEAYYYFIDNKLEDAYYLWEYLYEESKNKQDKLIAAFNLAVCMETMNNPTQALDWLNKSLAISQELNQSYNIDYLAYKKFLERQIKEKPYVEEQMRIFETIND